MEGEAEGVDGVWTERLRVWMEKWRERQRVWRERWAGQERRVSASQ